MAKGDTSGTSDFEWKWYDAVPFGRATANTLSGYGDLIDLISGEDDSEASGSDGSGGSSSEDTGSGTGAGGGDTSGSSSGASDEGAGSTSGDSGEPTTGRSPEVVPISGGQIRIYKDPTGGDDDFAIRDGIDRVPGSTTVQYGVEVARGRVAVSDLLSDFSPQPTDDDSAPADSGTTTSPDGQGDDGDDDPAADSRDAARRGDVDWGSSGMLGLPVGYKEGEGVVLPEGRPGVDGDSGNAAYDWLSGQIKDAAPGGAGRIDGQLDTGNENPPSSPTRPGGSTSESGGGTTNDPMDPTNINQATGREAAGSLFGSGGSSAFTGDSGSYGSGSGSSSGSGSGSGTGTVSGRDLGGWDPGTGFDAGGSSTGGSSTSGSGGDSSGGSDPDGTSNADPAPAPGGGDADDDDYDWESVDLDGDGVPDVEQDADGSTTTDEWSTTDDSDDSDDSDDQPGVATSVDPTGERYIPTTEDLQRSMENADFMRSIRTPIDWGDGSWQEDFGDGSEPPPPTPGVDQPGPDGGTAPSGEPGEVVFGGDQGGYTDPTDDTTSAPGTGPELDPLDGIGGHNQPPIVVPGTGGEPENQEPGEMVYGEVNIETTQPDYDPMNPVGYIAVSPEQLAQMEAQAQAQAEAEARAQAEAEAQAEALAAKQSLIEGDGVPDWSAENLPGNNSMPSRGGDADPDLTLD